MYRIRSAVAFPLLPATGVSGSVHPTSSSGDLSGFQRLKIQQVYAQRKKRKRYQRAAIQTEFLRRKATHVRRTRSNPGIN